MADHEKQHHVRIGSIGRVDTARTGRSSTYPATTVGDEEELPVPETPKELRKEKEDAKQAKEAIPPVPFRKLFSTADAKDLVIIFFATIGALGNGALLPLFALIFGEFTDAFGDPDGDIVGAASDLALKFTYIAIGAAVASYLEAGFFMYSGNRQANRLRQLYLQAVLRQDVAFFDVHATTGGLLQGLNEDSIEVQNAISEKLGAFLHHSCTFVTGFIIAFVRGWSMTLVMLGCMPFLAIIGAMLAKFTARMSGMAAASYADASAVAQQSISQIRTVAAYNQEERSMKLYEQALDGPRKMGIRQALMSGIALGGVQFVMYGTYAVGLFFGAHRVVAGDYTGGQVVQVVIATLMGGFSLGQAAPNLEHFAKGRAAAARMFKVIERVPEIDAGPTDANENPDGTMPTAAAPAKHRLSGVFGSGKYAAAPAAEGIELGAAVHDHAAHKAVQQGPAPLSSEVQGVLELCNVSFAYPARPDALIFRDFSLTIPAGHTVALVGSSGSGKSTVVGLIERFYDPLSGSVMLDGRDLRTLPLKWLRAQMGLVSQEPTLFATTIYENIVMGKSGAGPEEVEAAARAANAHNFVALLPDGYNTQVGERGTQLSGGQKQRIAIARAILKNPKILLLDEATSALDTRSERVVQDALDRMIVGRTTVVVAHRLSTIKNADLIAVVADGHVVEQGTHEELLQDHTGAYTNLVKLQMQAQDDDRHEDEEAAQHEGVAELPLDTAAHQHRPSGTSGADWHDADKQLMHHASTSGRLSLDPGRSGTLVDPSAHNGNANGTGNHYVVGVPVPGAGLLPGQLPRTLDGSAAPNSAALAGVGTVGQALALTVGEAATAASGAVQHQHSASGAAVLTGARSGSGELPGGSAPNSNTLVKLPDHKGGGSGKDGQPEGSTDKKDEVYPVPLKRLLAYNKPEWHLGVIGCFASGVAGVQHPAFAFIIASMIGIFYTSDMDYLKSRASFYTWMFFVIAVGAWVSIMLQQLSFGIMGQALARRLRSQLLGAMLRQEIAWFDDEAHASGKLTAHLATDAAHVRGAVGDVFGIVLQNLSTLAVGYLIGFAYDWRMALLITGVLPLVVLSALIHIKFHTGFASDADKLYSDANQTITEAFASIRVIQAYNLQSFVVGMYGRMMKKANTALVKQSNMSGVGLAYSTAIMFGMYGLIVYFMGHEIDKGWVDFDDSLTAFMAILLAAMGMAQAAVGFPDLAMAKGAVQRIFPILDRKPLIDSSSSEGIVPKHEAVVGEMEFQAVRFAYPARPNITIFKNFSLVVPAGQATALVGESGSGKSTVVGLVERFYDPLSGSVLLDGIDLKAYNVKALRSLVGLVSQEPLLFTGTVADNILFGKPDATQEEMEAAAEAANAKAFIDNLPDKYHTKVGEGGVQLSGGQKQRIAIARAVVKNPKILLLDEATSALDARAERLVQAALERIMQGRTSLVIAHRLSTIRNAQQIAVLYRGVILEKGTHDELMAIPKGNYARLVAAQMQSKSRGGAAAASMTRAAAAAAASPTKPPAAQ